MKESENRSSSLKRSLAEKRRMLKPQTLQVSEHDLVIMESFRPDQFLPLVIRPALAGVELASWVRNNHTLLQDLLLKHGGLLFRGFHMQTQADFERYLAEISAPLMHYVEGATPRVELGRHVYTSTIFPAERSIALHNELSYVMTWPMHIWFFCVTPSEQGGETPLADVRKVLQHISPDTRKRFVKKGWMLVRNFVPGFGLSWQTSFRTEEREAVERYCRNAHISWEWYKEDCLRTIQVRPAITAHPLTGEDLWFNHVAFWHISSLDSDFRNTFLAEYSLQELPYNTFYGDGSPIEDATAEELRQAYEQETIAFRWQVGDLLMLDNMLVAHGRNPFTGTRNILTAMGTPFTRPTIDTP